MVVVVNLSKDRERSWFGFGFFFSLKSLDWWRTLEHVIAVNVLRIKNGSVELHICSSCFFSFFHESNTHTES